MHGNNIVYSMCYICYHLQVLSQVKTYQKNKFINELQKNKNIVEKEEIGTDPFAAQ